MGRSINIYVIYTREDKDGMRHLLRHFKPLEENFNLVVWKDDPIKTGLLWKPQNESRLNLTDIFLLLVSDDFMHSKFIKQLEFKLVIDRYKDDKAKVIPIIISACQWDIDFKSDEYNFKLSELEVLPRKGKAIGDWDSPDKAYKQITDHLKNIITTLTENPNLEKANKELGEKAADPNLDDQLAIHFSDEAEAKRKAKEENRLREAAEAKRRAEEAEIRLKVEAETNRKAEVEARLKVAAKAKRKAEEENRLRQAVEAKKKVEQDNRLKAEVKANLRAEEEDRPKLVAEEKENVEETHQEKAGSLKKIVLVGSLIALLAALGIWAFSVFNSPSERQSTPLPAIKAKKVQDSVALSKTNIDSPNKITTLSKLALGDAYQGGIIFEIDNTGKRGKIAQLKDAGQMTWRNAMKIHEELGEGWRIPTFDELEIMYRTVGQGANNCAQFANDLYWSATDYDEYQARLLRFSDGNSSFHYNKELEHRKYLVRAIRDFSR